MLDELAAAARGSFEALGGDLVDPPLVLPASLPLELSGEAVRSRLCVLADPGPDGVELALRPDLTLAVCQQEAERRRSGGGGEAVRRYAARAFRAPIVEGDPLEFIQVGFERFGAPRTPDVDAKAFGAVHAAAAAAGASIDRIWCGDLSLFPAVVDAMNLSSTTAENLKRAFRRAGRVTSSLSDASRPRAAFLSKLGDLNPAEAEAFVTGMLSFAGVRDLGARRLDEVAERLLAQARDASDPPPPEAQRILDEILAIETPLEAAADTLAEVLNRADLSTLAPRLETLARSADAVTAAANGAEAWFGTPFGRRFNYYDGFVFEMFGPGAGALEPLAAGGRYDLLIGHLSGGAVETTAIGGVVRPDRIAAARGGSAA